MPNRDGRFVDVALPVPAPRPYTYCVPEDLAARVCRGARVIVPLRQRELVGIVVAEDASPPVQRSRSVLAAPDPEPALTPHLLRLAEWIAGYYGAPLGMALKSVLPGALWGSSRVLVRAAPEWSGAIGGVAGEAEAHIARLGTTTITALRRRFGRSPYAWINRLVTAGAVTLETERPATGPRAKTELVVTLTGEALSLEERDTTFRRAPARRKAYETLEAIGGEATIRDLRRQAEVSDGVVRGLAAVGLATINTVQVRRDPFSSHPVTPLIDTPTDEQRAALEAIGSAPPEHPVLLQGVTGSGKTFVYLDLIRQQMEAGKGAILLVPEIALTPQTVARVRGAFGDSVGVLHSGLSDGERVDAWWALRKGEYKVAVGPRSAVFAPVPSLGIIVVDEEHEASYKQSESPRYHARDVARVRGQIESARVVFGTATPSVETWAGTQSGAARRVLLTERVERRPLPRVHLVDITGQDLVTRSPVPWSTDLDVAITRALERGEQSIVFLNRRGFASFLQCPSCGATRDCPNCSVSLTVHRIPSVLRCHYCAFETAVSGACEQCGGAMERMRGLGTQQVEQFLADRYPKASIARMDLDTTSSKWAHHEILSRVASGETDILVGTQMIAKGHDFPNVTVVGVIDADVALHLPDFRAAERTFQLITQVAGRTGRGHRGGVVVVQTRSPRHYALTAAKDHDVDTFLTREMGMRAAPPYPPTVALLRILAHGGDAVAVERVVHRVAEWVRAFDHKHFGGGLTLVGPSPAPVERLRRRWRWHVLVKAEDSKAIGHLVRAWVRDGSARFRGAQIQFDRDPVALL